MYLLGDRGATHAFLGSVFSIDSMWYPQAPEVLSPFRLLYPKTVDFQVLHLLVLACLEGSEWRERCWKHLQFRPAWRDRVSPNPTLALIAAYQPICLITTSPSPKWTKKNGVLKNAYPYISISLLRYRYHSRQPLHVQGVSHATTILISHHRLTYSRASHGGSRH